MKASTAVVYWPYDAKCAVYWMNGSHYLCNLMISWDFRQMLSLRNGLYCSRTLLRRTLISYTKHSHFLALHIPKIWKVWKCPVSTCILKMSLVDRAPLMINFWIHLPFSFNDSSLYNWLRNWTIRCRITSSNSTASTMSANSPLVFLGSSAVKHTTPHWSLHSPLRKVNKVSFLISS